MYLVEMIAAPQTDHALLDGLETLLTTTLGKGVIRARDTPNFIANRIGIFSILATMRHTQTAGLGFDVVDALTGPVIGRAKSATYRTADVVGLDTMAHVVKTMFDAARRSVARLVRHAAGMAGRWHKARWPPRRRRVSFASWVRTFRYSIPRRATIGWATARSPRKWPSCSRSARPPKI